MIVQESMRRKNEWLVAVARARVSGTATRTGERRRVPTSCSQSLRDWAEDVGWPFQTSSTSSVIDSSAPSEVRVTPRHGRLNERAYNMACISWTDKRQSLCHLPICPPM